jgi:toxin ParE1/3/4
VTTYVVGFSVRARDALLSLYDYVKRESSAAVAKKFADAVVSHCLGLSVFPHRGSPRHNIRPGLRVTHYKGRTIIAFQVDDVSLKVTILDIFYGGRDHRSALELLRQP